MVSIKPALGALSTLLLALAASISQASIITVIETNLGGDAAAIVEPSGPGGTVFGEDALAFSDRTHQHNGAAFDAGGTLSTLGTTVVPLPNYLIGHEYVRFANNARENVDYSATVIADERLLWFLLVDNRLNGPAGNFSSSNTTDPELGGTLQWVIDGNWRRVNTGISPNGQADYTGVDEGGNGVGAGQALNQFYSVYRFALPSNVVTVFNNGIGASNMVSLVATPVPIPSALSLLALSLGSLTLLRKRPAGFPQPN